MAAIFSFAKKIRQPKYLALLILALPVSFLALFFIGESFGGEPGGFIHLLQIVPLILIAYLAFRHPRLGGIVLLIISTALGIAYAINSAGSFAPQGIAVTEIILFLPPIAAGFLLLKSVRERK